MSIFWLVIGLGLLRTSESIPPTLQSGAPGQYCIQQQCTDISTTLKALLTDQQTAKGKDCAELYKGGIRRSGVYTINLLNGGGDLDVYCDMKTDGGGWTMFQRRMDGSVDFYRDWAAYKYGFGNLNGEHWLGNKYIHLLSNQAPYELRVDLEDATREKRYAKYAYFAIGDEAAKYRLTAGAFSGNVGDSLSRHSGDPFSTKDRDNAKYSVNCAVKYKGAWWYDFCHASNLNGLYLLGDNAPGADGIIWNGFKGFQHSLKASEMKVRPIGFQPNAAVLG